MNTASKYLKKWLPLGVIFLVLIFVYVSDLYHFLSFEVLQANSELLTSYANKHYILASFSFMLLYIAFVAISLPGAALMTLLGGYLFGPIWGSLYVIVSATIGATILYYAVKLAFSDVIERQTSSWLEKLKGGFQKNAFSYLLTLRFIPIFPFWVVNVVPALLNMNVKHYVIATFIGIIPGSIIYVSMGNSLNVLLATSQKPNLSIILEPAFLLPLLGLAFLSVLPLLFKWIKAKRNKDD